jgi:hypothetical protein
VCVCVCACARAAGGGVHTCLRRAGFLLLAVVYVAVDVFKVWAGVPFKFLGENSILIYFCHEVFGVRVCCCRGAVLPATVMAPRFPV